MKGNENITNEIPADVPSETTGQKKKKKIRLKFSVTSVLFLSCGILVIGIVGFSFHSYIKINPSFCATCHSMETHVTSYLSGNHLDNVHAQANVLCKDCHSDFTIFDETRSLVQYVSGDYDEIFTKRKYGDEMCLQCHISMEYQADQTSFLVRNPHDSHFPDLRCGNCHVAHNDQVNYCSRCHDSGEQRMIEEINTASDS